jgi:hypothetical protein
MASEYSNRSEMDGFDLPPEIQTMFASYRDAIPDPEPGAQFMPQLWTRIDSRRKVNFSFGRLARAFVSVSLASCLAMSVVFMMPGSQTSPIYGATYLDALSADHNDDAIVDVELSHAGESL